MINEMTKKKKEINELIEHLKKYNDAIAIVGSKTITKIKEGTEDEEIPTKVPVYFQPNEINKNVFSRKNMIKNPKLFWKFYNEEVLKEKDENIIEPYKYIVKLTSMNIIKKTFDFNTDGFLYELLDKEHQDLYIPIRGEQHLLQCVKCKEKFSIDEIPHYDKIKEPITHDQLEHKLPSCDCKGKIKPTIPFYGEKYEQYDIETLFKCIFEYNDNNEPIGLKTHTLILIGVDLLDDLIDEIIMGFNKFKSNDKFTVFICENSSILMNDYQADFGTTYEHTESLKRLVKLLNE